MIISMYVNFWGRVHLAVLYSRGKEDISVFAWSYEKESYKINK